MKKMTDALIRSARTLAQVFVGGIVAANVLSGVDVSALTQVSEWEKIGLAAAFAGFGAVASYIHNVLEAKGLVPSTKG